MSLAAGTYYPAELHLMDSGNEASRFSVFGIPLTNSDDAGNIEEATTAWNNLVTKAMALVLGQKVKVTYWDEQVFAYTQTLNGANRETKLLIQYQDASNGKRYTCTLPTIDPTIPVPVENVNVKDAYRLDTPTAITDFITAFEAFVHPAENNAHAVTVVGLKVVGRNI